MKKLWGWIVKIFGLIGLSVVIKIIIGLLSGPSPDTGEYDDSVDNYNKTIDTNDATEVRREDYETDDLDYKDSLNYLNDILNKHDSNSPDN